jgi:plastocyanin
MPEDDTLTAEPPADAPPDETTAEATPPEAPPEARPSLEPAPDPIREARRTRLILPILLPIGAAVAMAVFVLNLSRVFLAAGDTGAIILGASMIIVILGGATIVSAAPRMRTSSLALILIGLFFVLASAGMVAAPRTAPHPAAAGGGNGLVNPKGPAVATLQIQAFPALHFQATQFTVKAGIVDIQYVSEGGNHTLAFDDPKYASFLLMAPGGPTSAKVLLKPGSYVVFCTVPGHRQAGMQATIIAQ